MRMLRRLHMALSSRMFVVYVIMFFVSALLVIALIPELMHTTRSFYQYDYSGYEPKDMERQVYELNKRIGDLERAYAVSKLNDREFEDMKKRLYRLREMTRKVEMDEEIHRLKERLKELEDATVEPH